MTRCKNESLAPARLSTKAFHLGRLMARHGWTVNDLARRTGLDERTLRELLDDDARPSAETLHRLAAASGIDARDLFQGDGRRGRRVFDRRTNPAVDALLRSSPQMFDGWTPDDFDDLYSRFGTGGELTLDGARSCAEAVNRRRRVMTQVGVLLETGEGDLLEALVEALCRRVTIGPNGAVEPNDGVSCVDEPRRGPTAPAS